MRVLGIDYGDSRIGVAVSDEGGKLAFDLCVIDATKGRKYAVSELLQLMDKYAATTLVIGLPTNMNGTKGDRVVKTEKFAKALKEASPDIEIIFEDERLTTKYADRLMLESGKHQKQKGVSDKLAAMIILQGYLDRSKL
ncbi:MAG: Holliday junction resolvase RuvX [Ruminococcaceae bacterium]|nr:Holliday junction resolvase RuvX [Oscillospiraceae bacterium]